MKNRDIPIKNNKYTIFSIIFILFSVIIQTVAYADCSSTGRIENIMASVNPLADARVTNVMVHNTANGGMSNSEEYNVSKVYGSINLPNSNSTVTYKVDVTVFFGMEMKITNISGLNSHLDYELSSYTLGEPLCNSNDECNYGATQELFLTIKYKEGEYDSSNTLYPLNIDFTFEEVNYIARIGNIRYETLQEAINTVPTNNTETTIILLKNTSESLTVNENQNINFELGNNVISNNGNFPVISNFGTVSIHNGTLTCSSNHGAFNNEATGVFNMSGGSILATGNRQAIYNNGGTILISGDSYLSAVTNQRATITNLQGSTATILGGTIISTRLNGIDNSGSLTIGFKDGSVDSSTPSIRGNTYGVNSTTNFNFYDGILKGKTEAISDESFVADIETNKEYVRLIERISNVDYKTVHLGDIVRVIFDPNGGTVTETERNAEVNVAIGYLPTPTWYLHEFNGWYTSATGGRKIDQNEIINAETTFYAQWTDISSSVVADVNGVTYKTLQAAINNVGYNTQTTITILNNTSETLTIPNNKNIILDIGNHTISNKGNSPVFTNKGTLTIISGTISSSATQGAINNESGGTLTVSGGTISATGTRQAIYNNGGTAYITGNAYISSTTSERATVQNLNNGVVTITGGTIVSTGFNAIENVSTMNIGTKDGTIDSTTPVIQGVNYGINSSKTLNFYDGIIKGKNNTINGTISDQEQNSTKIDSTEMINGELYQISYLQ